MNQINPRLLKKGFYRVIIIISIFFIYVTATAQEKPSKSVDTTNADPYRMMQGHRIAHSKFGEVNIRPYTYFRYLNQLGYDKSYTDAFGKTQSVDRRQDIQLNKVSIYFSGW